MKWFEILYWAFFLLMAVVSIFALAAVDKLLPPWIAGPVIFLFLLNAAVVLYNIRNKKR